MIEDLAKSGIKSKHVKALKLEVLTGKQTVALGHQYSAASYKLPYFGTNGKVAGYHRVRYLEQPKGAFGEKPDKVPRYTGPSGKRPYAYFPPVIDWADALSDTDTVLVITEGEKKAIAGCLAGWHVIGLGGVAMFQAMKEGYDLLPELDDFELNNRIVVICYDSDKHTNHNIMRDQTTLATRLLERGAHVMLTDIPTDKHGEKMGLDDYLVQYDEKDWNDELTGLLTNDEHTYPYVASRELYRLNDEVAYIRKQGAYYHFEQEALRNEPTRLQKTAYANQFYEKPAPTEEDINKTKTVNVFEEWFKWPQRREHSDLVYEPGCDSMVTEDNSLNMWKGWGCDPVEGDISPFTELLDHLVSVEPEVGPWLWQWLAYPLQNPGAKLYSAVLLHSPMQGTGKTFLGEIVGDIYGRNFTTLSQDDLTNNYTYVFANKQFALADEVIAAKDGRKHADRLKSLITQEQMKIEKKFEPIYFIRDTINYLFTSNHVDALYIEDADRRYCVIKVPSIALPTEFYDKVRAWRRSGGPAHLFYHLLHNVDCSTFRPTAAPPRTKAHNEMKNAVMSDVDAWAYAIRESEEALVPEDAKGAKVHDRRELFTPTEALKLYDPVGHKGTYANSVGKALAKVEFPIRELRVPGHGKLRLWALRNSAHWEAQPGEAWRAQYLDQMENKIRSKVT